MKKLPGSLLICTLLLRADFQPSRWKYRRQVPADAGPTIRVLNLDRDIYVHSNPDLSDLRVLRGEDEVPYVLEKMSGSHEWQEVSNSVLDQGVTASGDLELIVDVGKDRRHNGVRLATPKINFRHSVSVSTSDDRRTWARVRDDGYIFDFSRDERHASVRDVTYPVSTRRYVRVTVYGWNDPSAVTACWVTLEDNKPPVRDTMAWLKAEPQPEPKTQSTLYTWDLGIPGIPYEDLWLDVETSAFQRAALVETSRDGKEWTAKGQGVLSRFRKEQPVAIDFSESHERYLRLRVYNRDDRPLAIKAAALRVIRTRVKLQQDVRGSYWLYYGNADSHAPSYDMRDLLRHDAPSPEFVIRPSAEEGNPAYREKPEPAKPWSEQHPEILYVTLALAVVAMGIVTVRFLRKVGAENH